MQSSQGSGSRAAFVAVLRGGCGGGGGGVWRPSAMHTSPVPCTSSRSRSFPHSAALGNVVGPHILWPPSSLRFKSLGTPRPSSSTCLPSGARGNMAAALPSSVLGATSFGSPVSTACVIVRACLMLPRGSILDNRAGSQSRALKATQGVVGFAVERGIERRARPLGRHWRGFQ